MQKRFLVGIDWFRSEPVALDALSALPGASVRVVDGERVVDIPGCRPVRSYHPKAFVFRKDWPSTDGLIGCLVGSGNLSRNGLSVGHELDLWSCSVGSSADVIASLSDIHDWFESLWASATPYSAIRNRYRPRFEAHQRTSSRATTDDDAAPEVLERQRGLKGDDLVVIRSFDNLWIDTGSMYSNLGPGVSGNQIDLRRYTRVFFGFPPSDLPKNAAIGGIPVVYGGTVYPDRHLRYGNNEMDKLNLPVPATGTIDYRNKTLLFTRTVGPNGSVRFTMEIGQAGDRSKWRTRSRRAKTAFKFGGGSQREFGVF